MDQGAWQATVNGVAKSWTRVSDFRFIISSQGQDSKTPSAPKKKCRPRDLPSGTVVKTVCFQCRGVWV